MLQEPYSSTNSVGELHGIAALTWEVAPPTRPPCRRPQVVAQQAGMHGPGAGREVQHRRGDALTHVHGQREPRLQQRGCGMAEGDISIGRDA